MAHPQTFLTLNPTAGTAKKKRILTFCSYLKAYGTFPELFSPSSAKQACAITRKIVDKYPNATIIPSGGDGTISPIMRGLLGSQAKLGILPAGTANVFAREMRLPLDLKVLARIITKGHYVEVWPGIVQFPQASDSAQEQLFIQMLGCGPDAWSVQHISNELKRKIGRYAYAVSGIKTLRKYPFHNRLEINIDGEDYNCSSLIISKGIYYAGGYQIAPVSAQRKRNFNVILFNERKPSDWLKRCLAIGTGQIRRLAGVKIIPAQRVEVTSPEPIPVQYDGDFCGFTPFSVQIAPNPVHVIVPSL